MINLPQVYQEWDRTRASSVGHTDYWTKPQSRRRPAAGDSSRTL